MPRLTAPMFAVPPGEIYPRRFEPGEIVEGRLAEIAGQLGLLEPVAHISETGPRRAPRNKAGRPQETK